MKTLITRYEMLTVVFGIVRSWIVRFRILLILLGVTGVSGCGVPLAMLLLGPPTLLDLGSIPKEVLTVCTDTSRFAQDLANPLITVEPGTVVNDLSELAGCWGAFVDSEVLGPPDSQLCEFYRFDVDNSTLEYQVFGRDSLVGEVVLVHHYALEFPSADRIRITLAEVEFIDDDGVLITEPVANVSPWELQVTLDGEEFSFADSLDASTDFGAPHRAPLVFQRFDCSEAQTAEEVGTR